MVMIGERMRQLRENIGMPQIEAAKRIGVSKQTLYKYEKGIISNIPSDKIEAAARLFGVEPAYIMGWGEKEEKAELKELPLSEPERNLLKYFRALPGFERGMLLGYAQRLYDEDRKKDTSTDVAM